MSIYRGIALTVSGSDSSGVSGLQADLKTFAALKIFGASVVTTVMARNSRGTQAIHDVPSSTIVAQLQSVRSDFSAGAIKTGLMNCSETIEAVARTLSDLPVIPLVVDPVMVAPGGDVLVDDATLSLFKDEVLPRALLVTPSVAQAEVLSGLTIESAEEMEQAAQFIAELGPQAVLIKGEGLLEGDDGVDLLYFNGQISSFPVLPAAVENLCGTGCTLSAAITAELAAGATLRTAVERGRQYVEAALACSFQPGQGCGALGHPVEVPWLAPSLS